MTVLRRMLAGLAIVAGVVTLLVWAVASFAVRTVEDGTLIKNVATAALKNPAVEKAIVEKAQDAVSKSFKKQGINLKQFGLEGAVDDVVASLITSETFSRLVEVAVESTHEELTLQLTAPDRVEAPLAVKIDLSLIINEGFADTPILSDLVPEVAVPPISVEVLDAAKFERVRHVYSWIDTVATWAGWLGLAFIVAGILLTPNKRWFVPKLLFWIGGLGVVAWLALKTLDAERLAAMVPGGADGELGSTVRDLIPQESIASIAGRTLVFALIALAVAAVLSVLIRGASRRKSADGRHSAGTAAHSR